MRVSYLPTQRQRLLGRRAIGTGSTREWQPSAPFGTLLTSMARNPSAARSLTLEEWAGLDEDTPGELVDGRLEEEEMPTFLHEAVVAWLLWALRSWVVPLGGIA